TGGALLDLTGTATLSAGGAGTLDSSGGTVNLSGILNNSGLTQTLNGPWNLLSGLVGAKISGGTLNATAAGSLALGASQTATLDGVTLAVDLSLDNASTLTVNNGLTLSGSTVHLIDQGNGVLMTFVGTQSLAGNGQVNFEGLASGNNVRAV